MPNSNRMQWPYPSENQQPWFDAFEDFVSAQDASAYASREDRQSILTEGGTISWTVGTSTLEWSANLSVTSPISGFLQNVEASSLVIDAGEVVYVTLTRAPTNNQSLTPVVASQVPSTDSAFVLAVRVGDKVYWRNGLSMDDGDSLTGIGSSQGGGGGSSGDGVVQHAANATVLGTTFTLVGSIFLPAGTVAAATSRVMLGTDQVADTADLEIRRFTGGTVVDTLSATGVLQDVQPSGDIAIPAEDWYDLYLKSDVPATNAILRGVKFEYTATTGTGVRQAFEQSQTGTTPLLVGSVYLVAGTLQATSKCMMGTSAGGTATVELRRFTGGAVITTWAASGARQNKTLGATAAIAAADWYDVYLYGDAGPTVAEVWGMDWTVLV